jgi:hypothetical protein
MSLLAGSPNVNVKIVFPEDLGPCGSVWKNPRRTRGYKWDLLKVRKGNTKGAWWHSGVCWQRECAFLFQVLLKLTLTHGRADPGDSHPMKNQWVGAWVVPSQVRVVWAIPGEAYISPKLFLLLACIRSILHLPSVLFAIRELEINKGERCLVILLQMSPTRGLVSHLKLCSVK